MGINIQNFKSVASVKAELLPLVTPDAPPQFSIVDNKDFLFLKEILSSSLDEYTRQYLEKCPPVTSNFILLDIAEHLSEAMDIISKNQLKRNEIFEIEAQALLKAVEYTQFISSIESEKKLAELNLEAMYKQSGTTENIEVYKKTLKSKFDNIESTLQTKLSLHNQPGSPLNYSERVSSLREIYSSNIKVIYERSIAIKRTLLYAFGQETPLIPNLTDSVNNLDKLIGWIRKAVYEFEVSSQRDYIMTKSVSLNNPFTPTNPAVITPNPNLDAHTDAAGHVLPTIVSEAVKTLKTDGVVEFDINLGEFEIEKNFFETMRSGKKRLRVLGVAITIVEQLSESPFPASLNQRVTRLYQSELIPPKQDVALEIKDIYDISDAEKKKFSEELHQALTDGKPPPNLVLPHGTIIGMDVNGKVLFEKGPVVKEPIEYPSMLLMGESGPVWQTGIYDKIEFHSDPNVKNINPIGKWTLYLKNVSPNNMYRAFGLSQVENIVLTFKIAIRKAK